MNTSWQRTLIPIATTTILHASIFYSLSSVHQLKIVSKKPIEISLIEQVKIEKKEELKPKKEPKPLIKQEPIIKPKPIIKKEPKIEPKQLVKEVPIIKQEPIVEKEPPAKSEINTETKESLVAQEKREKQEMSAKKSEDELALYLSKIRTKIQENLRYPSLAKRFRLEGECIVEFEILNDGSVEKSSIKIKNSSGHRNLDEKAVETILGVSPFDAPPNGKMEIILPVAFKLNK